MRGDGRCGQQGQHGVLDLEMAADECQGRLNVVAVGIGVDAVRQWDFAQPSELAFGKLAGGGNAFFDKGVVIGQAFEVIPCLPVADAAHRGHIGGQFGIFLAQSAHFVDEALFQHLCKTAGDVFVQQGAVFGNQGGGAEVERRGVVGFFGKMRAQGLAGQTVRREIGRASCRERV